MKKLLVLLLGVALSLTFLSCTGEENSELLQSDEEVLAVQAISSSMLLSYNQTQTVLMADEVDGEGLTEEEVNDIDDYVEMVETMLGNDQLQVETRASDNEEYDYMMVYQTTNLSGESLTYTLYYNLVVLEEEPTSEEPVTDLPTTEEPETDTPTTEEPTTDASTTDNPTTEDPVTDAPTNLSFREDNFRFQDEDDEYVTQYLEGKLIFGEFEYDIEGKILVVEGKEIIRLRSFIDENNVVLVNYQSDDREVDKEKFFFQIVEDGQLVSRSRVMIFENDNMQHVQIEFIEGENYERYQFHLRERNDVTYIHINYRIDQDGLVEEGNVRLTKTIDPETGEAIYDYAVTPNQGQGRGYQRKHEHDQERGNNMNPNTRA